MNEGIRRPGFLRKGPARVQFAGANRDLYKFNYRTKSSSITRLDFGAILRRFARPCPGPKGLTRHPVPVLRKSLVTEDTPVAAPALTKHLAN
jgi:hypothetical protein